MKEHLITKKSCGSRHIAQVIQHLNPGGIESIALDLASSETGQSCKHLISLEGNYNSALCCWPRLKKFTGTVKFFQKKPGIRIGLIRDLVKYFKKNSIQVVHTHHIGPLLYAGIAARIAGIKTIIHTEHDGWHLQSRKRRLLQRLIVCFVKPTLVADAQLVARNMQRYLGISPHHIIYNGIDTKRFIPGEKLLARIKMNLPISKKIIGCAGRLEIVKGHDLLIEALSSMPRSIHLAIAGNGSQLLTLKNKAQIFGVADRVHFLGLVEDMPSFYQSLDLFCLPSREEGYPLSSLEAQSCGIPAAVTDVGGARESLCPITGTLLQPNSPKLIAKSLAWQCFAGVRGNPRSFVKECGDIVKMHLAYAKLSKE